MISDVIEYLKTQLESQYPEIVVKWAEKLKKDDQEFVAEYVSNGQYYNIDLDAHKALVYIRANGEVTTKEIDEEEAVSCEVVESHIYPVRVIFFATNDFRNSCNASDSGTTRYSLSESLKNTITVRNDSTLKALLKSYSVYVRVNSIDTDKQRVADEENLAFDYDHSLIALNAEIEIIASQSCFEDCNTDSYLVRLFSSIPVSVAKEGIIGAGKESEYTDSFCSPAKILKSDTSTLTTIEPGSETLLSAIMALATATELKGDLSTAGKLAGIIQLLSDSDLNYLTPEQVQSIIQALYVSVLYGYLTTDQLTYILEKNLAHVLKTDGVTVLTNINPASAGRTIDSILAADTPADIYAALELSYQMPYVVQLLTSTDFNSLTSAQKQAIVQALAPVVLEGYLTGGQLDQILTDHPGDVYDENGNLLAHVVGDFGVTINNSLIKDSAGITLHSVLATQQQTIADSHIRKADGITNLLNIKAENYKTTTDVYTAASASEIAADISAIGFAKAQPVYQGLWSAMSKYNKILQRGYELGATLPNAALQAKQLQLITDLGTNWDSMDFLLVFANNILDDFGRINWINPQLPKVLKWNSPDLATTGYDGNSSSWLITDYNPKNTKGGLNDYYFGGAFNIDNTETKAYMGAGNASDVGVCAIYSNGLFGVNSKALLSHGLGAVSGVMFAHRSDASNAKFFLNGTTYTFADTLPVQTDNVFHVLSSARVGLTSGNNICSFHERAKIIVGGKLSAANLTQIQTAFNTYLASL